AAGWESEWQPPRHLIQRTVAEAKTVPDAVLASGAGTDHLEPGPRVTLADVEAADEEQCAWIERCGGRSLPRVGRVHGPRRRSDHPEGEPRPRRGGPDPGRLPEGLRAHPQPGAGAGHHSLAR